MKLPKSWTTVTTFSKALALIIFVTFPFVGAYVGYKYGKTNSISLSSKFDQTILETSKKQVVAPTIKADPTAKWKTYTDSKYGYTFRYPSTWRIGKVDPAGTAVVAVSVSPFPEDFLVSILATPNDTVKNAVASVKSTYVYSGSPTELISEKNITFNNKQAVELVFQNVHNQITTKTIVLAHNDLVYRLTGGGEADNTNSELVLSSFKFTK